MKFRNSKTFHSEAKKKRMPLHQGVYTIILNTDTVFTRIEGVQSIIFCHKFVRIPDILLFYDYKFFGQLQTKDV